MDTAAIPTEPSPPNEVPSDASGQTQQLLADIRSRLAEANAVLLGAAEAQGQASAATTQAASTLATAKQVASEAQELIGRLATIETTTAEQVRQIKETQEHVIKIRSQIDEAKSESAAVAAEVEGRKVVATASSDACAELLEKVKQVAQLSGEEVAKITESRLESKKAEDLLSGMASKAASAEERVAAYEKRLAELEKKSAEQLETIVGLLPGATSAGLAFAFDERRKSFMAPSRRWQWLFVGSVASLVLLAGSGLFHVYQVSATVSYDELFRLWLARLPVAAALVWLAIYASRESGLAKRLEEDYGYKAAIAASFLGFNRQMSELTEKAGPNTPLSILCSDTLATIASPPGRIYDKHQLTVTPADELKGLVKDATALLAKADSKN